MGLLSPAAEAGNPAQAHLAAVRAEFESGVAAGAARRLVLPLDALGSVALPMAYLCVPHAGRPWLRRARFAVVAAVAALNWDMMGRASSPNSAFGYGAGLIAAWGIMWGLTTLVWTDAQGEGARVDRRRRRSRKMARREGNGAVVGVDGDVSGKRKGKEGGKEEDKVDEVNLRDVKAPDETVAAALADGYEYYWQAYPADGPFLERLDWVFDYISGFRGAGWTTTCIHSIPAFRMPASAHGEEPVDLSSIPQSTKAGYSRHLTVRSFLRARLARIALGYLVLDACIVTMRRDPYFIFGPDYPPQQQHHLPPYLAALPLPLVEVCRTGLSLFVILSTLYLLFALGQVAQFLGLRLLRPARKSCRADLWQYPSVFGGFAANVLDHGLGGFWGGWWHQTFRGAFVAPTGWMARRGYLPADRHHPAAKAVVALLAFGQSSLLHAGGSRSSLDREARWWSPPVFFMLSLVGVVVQAAWVGAVGGRARWPRWLRRAGNLAFSLAWLHFTRGWFIDDLNRGAVWLFEPLPVSAMRWAGLGDNGDDRVWRWAWDDMPRWYVGKRWWESGLAV